MTGLSLPCPICCPAEWAHSLCLMHTGDGGWITLPPSHFNLIHEDSKGTRGPTGASSDILYLLLVSLPVWHTALVTWVLWSTHDHSCLRLLQNIFAKHKIKVLQFYESDFNKGYKVFLSGGWWQYHWGLSSACAYLFESPQTSSVRLEKDPGAQAEGRHMSLCQHPGKTQHIRAQKSHMDVKFNPPQMREGLCNLYRTFKVRWK